MDNTFNMFKIGLVIISGYITAILGGWDAMLKVLVIMVIADYFTGVVAAWFEKKLNSEIGLKGIAKKILLFIPVVIGYKMDVLLGEEFLRSLAIWFYISNEGLSCLENLARAGIPLPDALKTALEQLQKKGAA